MPNHDKIVSATSLLATLVLLGCGSSHKQNTANPDSGQADAMADAGKDASPGPEAGPEVLSPPTDPALCAQATNVPTCDPSTASATISSASGGSLLASVAVTNGSCLVSACPSGCASIAIQSGISPAGSTCDLLVTATDGRSQQVRIAIVQNPAAIYACCGVPLLSNSGQWIALNPTVISPSSFVVDFQLDAGVPGLDVGTDSPGKLDTNSVDADNVDTGTDVLSGTDGKPDAYVMATDEQTCLKSTNVPSCDIWSPYTEITSATAGLLLAKVQVTAGPCIAGACASACASISVLGTSLSLGGTCDLLVTATDGRSRSLRLAAVATPSPSHMCCGYPQPPYSGIWTAVDPMFFSPTPAAVDFASDGGTAVIDGGGPRDANQAE